MLKEKIEWANKIDFPGQHGVNGFSIDVLVYCKKLDVHTVGYFEYNKHKWHFLCNEQHIVAFKWRYFQKEIDKY